MVSWISILIPSYILGVTVLDTIGSKAFERRGDRIIISLWLGASLLGVILYSIALLVPLSPIVGLTAAASISVLCLMRNSTRQDLRSAIDLTQGKEPLLIPAATAVAAAISIRQVIYWDTGSYHFHAIRWLSRYGIVPGLALLHDRLGFTSSWFALAAPFHAWKFETHIGALLSGITLTLALTHIFIIGGYIHRKISFYADYFALCALLLYLHYALITEIGVSASPDLPVNVLSILIVYSMLVVVDREKISIDTAKGVNRVLPVILSAGAVAIKLSALPLLIVTSIFWLAGKKSLSEFFTVTLTICAILLSTVLASIVTSGCVIYPASFSCIDLPWAVGSQSASVTSNVIRNFARWGTYEIKSGRTSEWMVNWAEREPIAPLLVALSCILIAYLIRKRTYNQDAGLKWVFLTSITCITFLMFNAPSMRFGYAYFLLLPAYAASLQPKLTYRLLLLCFLMPGIDFGFRSLRFLALIKVIVLVGVIIIYLTTSFIRNEAWSRAVFYGSVCLVMLFPLRILGVKIFSNVIANNGLKQYYLLPPPLILPSMDKTTHTQTNDIKYVVAIGPEAKDQCWATEIPCTPDPIRGDIRLRDSKRGIGGGFVRRN
jgi:hypothetical protein